MPLPILFIGVAAATGGLGIGKTIKAGVMRTMLSRSIKVQTKLWRVPPIG